MYIYHALINTLSAHMIHINLNMIFYTPVEHSPTKTIDIKHYTKKTKTKTKTKKHTHTSRCQGLSNTGQDHNVFQTNFAGLQTLLIRALSFSLPRFLHFDGLMTESTLLSGMGDVSSGTITRASLRSFMTSSGTSGVE